MPYIITTATTAEQWQRGRVTTRHAVATLDEAQDRIVCDPLSAHDEHPLFPHWRSQALMLPESGGTIGPLPDGTVIKVQPISWDELADRCDASRLYDMRVALDPEAELLDDFNAYNAR